MNESTLIANIESLFNLLLSVSEPTTAVACQYSMVKCQPSPGRQPRVPGYFNIFPRQREIFFMSIISSRWAASHLTCACNNFISRPRLMNLTVIFSNSNFKSLILLLLSITVEYFGQGQIDHSHSEDIFFPLGFGYHIHCDQGKKDESTSSVHHRACNEWWTDYKTLWKVYPFITIIIQCIRFLKCFILKRRWEKLQSEGVGSQNHLKNLSVVNW